GLAIPAAALALSQAEGWAKWTAKANQIYAAVDDGQPPSEGKRQKIKGACTGASGTLSGWSAPYWATNIVGLCRHVDDEFGPDRTISRAWGRGECMEMKEVRGQLRNGADKGVADQPDVQPAAKKLFALADSFYTTYCTKDGRKQMRDAG
ncbi:MAG TPA: hypothetical protein VF409_00450, partial [Sphingomonas sp.]